MATKRFTINVPNPSDGAAAPELRLEPVPEAELTALGYDLPAERLQILATRMTTNAPASTLTGCLDAIWVAILTLIFRILRRPVPLRPRPLTVRLAPQSSADIHVVIHTAGGAGAAAMHLVDRRDGRVVGGVTLLVVEGLINAPGGFIPARSPCPLELAEPMYWLPAGSEPDAPRPGGPIPAGYDVELVAWVRNVGGGVLSDATAYLEHLGGAQADFRPARWNIGSIESGVGFPLMWRARGQLGAGGLATASIVVEAKGYDPTRLRADLDFGELHPAEVITDVDVAFGPA